MKRGVDRGSWIMDLNGMFLFTNHDSRFTKRGFTLIEVVVAVALSVIILGALHFSLVAALESWRYSRDELALQKTMADTLGLSIDGTKNLPGLRSALEITLAEEDRLEFIEACEETHRLFNPKASIQLRGHIKPGTGLPTAEYRIHPEAPFLPVDLILDNVRSRTERARYRTAKELPAGSQLRLSYHPHPRRNPDSLIEMSWNKKTRQIEHLYRFKTEILSKNMFGAIIERCVFRYYDHTNRLLNETSFSTSGREWLPLITAVEVELSGRLNDHTLTLPGMVMLRNSPRQSGLIALEPNMTIPIADSRSIKTLALGNFVGISHNDRIQVEIDPEIGSTYRVTLEFEDLGKTEPLIGLVQVEFPVGKIIFSDSLRTQASQGFDLLTLGPNGLYDYDDDANVNDPVYVPEGPAFLRVKQMDIRGAGCYLRP